MKHMSTKLSFLMACIHPEFPHWWVNAFYEHIKGEVRLSLIQKDYIAYNFRHLFYCQLGMAPGGEFDIF